MVRALAPHQCTPGSNPGVDAICGLGLLLVLSFAPRGFSPGSPVFPSPQKPAFPNSNSTRNQVDEDPLRDVLPPNHCLIWFNNISFPSLHVHDMKIPNFLFCGGPEHKTTTFFFFSCTSIKSFRIKLQKKIANI